MALTFQHPKPPWTLPATPAALRPILSQATIFRLLGHLPPPGNRVVAAGLASDIAELATASPSASAAWIRSHFEPVALTQVNTRDWSSFRNFSDSIGNLLYDKNAGEWMFRQRDDMLHLRPSETCPAHRMLYLARCVFPEAEIHSEGPNGYCVIATMYMRHKETGNGVAFTEWKGAFSIRFQLDGDNDNRYYKAMHPACIGNTFLADFIAMMNLLSPNSLLKDYPHPSALAVEAPQYATAFLTTTRFCMNRDGDYKRAELAVAPWTVMNRDRGDVDLLSARRDRKCEVTFDPATRTSKMSKTGETVDASRLPIGRVIGSDLLFYRLLSLLKIPDTWAVNVPLPHVSGLGELQMRERAVGVWSVVLQGPGGCKLCLFDLRGLSEVVVVEGTDVNGVLLERAVCDLLNLLCSDVSPHPYDELVAGYREGFADVVAASNELADNESKQSKPSPKQAHAATLKSVDTPAVGVSPKDAKDAKAFPAAVPYNGIKTETVTGPPAASVEVEEFQVPNANEAVIAEHRINPNFFIGDACQPFDEKVLKVLNTPLNVEDVEIKPSGEPYLPEIKYRRILNKAFGQGGWFLISSPDEKREGKVFLQGYTMWAHGRFVGMARGEHTNQMGEDSWGKSIESAKSNALVRICKDLGVASELWDPHFISEFKRQKCSSRKNAKGGDEWFLNKRPPPPRKF
ncbi:hypothetical protein HK101_003122 [Irineochytrium annulatum]|nr:hypothetical protein HK101_003122 [Irineochytrium annulatum]